MLLRYHRDEAVRAAARRWIDRIDGRKIFTKGTLHNGDTLCCESEGLFISMPAELMHVLRKGRDSEVTREG